MRLEGEVGMSKYHIEKIQYSNPGIISFIYLTKTDDIIKK
jgi:hypothetical protein